MIVKEMVVTAGRSPKGPEDASEPIPLDRYASGSSRILYRRRKRRERGRGRGGRVAGTTTGVVDGQTK